MYTLYPIIIFHHNKSFEYLLWKRTRLQLLPCHVSCCFLQPKVVCFEKREGDSGPELLKEAWFSLFFKIMFVFHL